MPFSKRIRLDPSAYARRDSTFHLTLHAMPGTTPFRSELGAAVWQLILNERERSSIELVAACLMPDHLHALAKPADRSIVLWVNGFKSFSTRVAWQHGQASALWQPGFHDTRIRDEQQFEAALSYVRKNPVAAGLVNEEREWPWLWWREA